MQILVGCRMFGTMGGGAGPGLQRLLWRSMGSFWGLGSPKWAQRVSDWWEGLASQKPTLKVQRERGRNRPSGDPPRRQEQSDYSVREQPIGWPWSDGASREPSEPASMPLSSHPPGVPFSRRAQLSVLSTADADSGFLRIRSSTHSFTCLHSLMSQPRTCS